MRTTRMDWKGRTIGLLVLAAALAPASARALESSWYFGGAVGQKVTAGPLALSSERFGRVESEDKGYKLLGGLGLGSHLAVEASWVNLGRQRFDAILDFGFDVDVDGYSAAVVGTWPIGRLSLFGKAGSFWWSEEGQTISLLGVLPYSKDGRDLLLGAGAKLEITPNLLVRGEWERFEFDDEHADDLWLGLEVRF